MSSFSEKWNTCLEKILLRGYREKIDAFMNTENKREVWEQLVKVRCTTSLSLLILVMKIFFANISTW